MKKKRWVSYLIALTIALTIMPKPVSAEEEIAEEFDLSEGNVVIEDEGTYRIIQSKSGTTTNTITVDVTDAKDIYIILNGVNIDVSETSGACAFKIADDSQAKVTVELEEGTTNTLKSGIYCAGLQKNGDGEGIGTLTITGTGTLEATGEIGGAGIGGGGGKTGSNITITGGIVIATAKYVSAGIGGGDHGSGSNIKISGGTVTATGGYGSNGIGSGDEGTDSSNIIITGGSVKTVGNNADDIGTTPTDGKNNYVYPVKVPNLDKINSVTVDKETENKKEYTRQGNHPDNDSAFYLYLTKAIHTITIDNDTCTATWNDQTNSFTVKAPTPIVTVDSSKTTASSITVNELPNQNIYGEMECSIDGNNWTTGNILTNLQSANFGGKYTVYARYKSNSNYLESDTGQVENVSTNSASYTISIPSTTLTAGNSSSTGTVSVNTSEKFDLGYNGHIDVKVKKDDNISNDGKLTLKRQNDNTGKTITTALKVNGNSFTDITQNIISFDSLNYQNDLAIISFAKPEGNIPAGTYKGTITFEVSYDE